MTEDNDYKEIYKMAEFARDNMSDAAVKIPPSSIIAMIDEVKSMRTIVGKLGMMMLRDDAQMDDVVEKLDRMNNYAAQLKAENSRLAERVDQLEKEKFRMRQQGYTVIDLPKACSHCNRTPNPNEQIYPSPCGGDLCEDCA